LSRDIRQIQIHSHICALILFIALNDVNPTNRRRIILFALYVAVDGVIRDSGIDLITSGTQHTIVGFKLDIAVDDPILDPGRAVLFKLKTTPHRWTSCFSFAIRPSYPHPPTYSSWCT